MKLISLEVDSVEPFLGRDACRLLRDLVLRQHVWARERVGQIVEVRKAVGSHIMDPVAHRWVLAAVGGLAAVGAVGMSGVLKSMADREAGNGPRGPQVRACHSGWLLWEPSYGSMGGATGRRAHVRAFETRTHGTRSLD